MKATGTRRLKMGAAIVVASLAVWSGAGLANHFRNFNPSTDMDDMVRGQFPEGFKTKKNPQRIQINAKVPVDVFSLDLTLDPGEQTPLHWHEGPALITVSRGEVTEFGQNCEALGRFRSTGQAINFGRTTLIGEAFLDEAQPDDPHFIRNTGSGPAELRMVAIIPKGAQPFNPVSIPPPVACPQH